MAELLLHEFRAVRGEHGVPEQQGEADAWKSEVRERQLMVTGGRAMMDSMQLSEFHSNER